MREGTTMVGVPTFDDVASHLPRDWWGPKWREVVDDAITAYAERAPFDIPSERDDFAHEFADGWPSVYTADIMEAYNAYGLWNVQSVTDEVEGFGGYDANDMVRGATLHLYAVALLAMRAVLSAADDLDEDEESE